MSLVLKLGPSEQLFINGAVLCNGDRRNNLLVENVAHILREKDIMHEAEACTPVRAAYFAAQNVLLNTRVELGSAQPFHEQVEQLRSAFVKPEHLRMLSEAERLVHVGNIYKALGVLRDLLLYEAALLNQAPPDRFRRDSTSPTQPVGNARPVSLRHTASLHVAAE